ncbi:bifunctional 4-hydroxy-2-oxoglutarate aldolase/2-dehydro-3-deoxy-phosphogluconate aldolase [Oscillatoria sp. CS-180]|uniref:bifunctional 4-hydroxy-2-oxoglutarate aldolase/2-dehydro-3-deoxy-phosphogluconate aldolase n=1 Tax=Oscillatoria sp. CS-180 TaxID=3021720 RepID=UPI00232F9A0E|nr:bifunctional 4-hydroxy-2-oxoglutarate aldolase/2-dehydro-3-deoxy-phosphogluconate aldolase [Oscillatoria sp. CS-180]MDB9529240.1 bifunctional 4-hydroxy-2-oxoglutarate aldolase/2-dehydro-3-deoxy-phosphogluconate aldolase [Oscillatoria sp. CS-180]
MDRDVWLAMLKQHRAIAVLRAPTLDMGIAMAHAAAKGGFHLIEVTWNSDRPAHLISQLRQGLPSHCRVGVGTILSSTDMKAAIIAGAEFCFAPYTDPDVIQLCQHHDIPVTPGALTPTEIMAAWQLGASSIKVFPCQSVGGAAYIRHLQGPLRHIPLIPTGGILLEEGQAFIHAGAIAVGVSSSLFPKDLLAKRDWETIQARSLTFLKSLQAISAP